MWDTKAGNFLKQIGKSVKVLKRRQASLDRYSGPAKSGLPALQTGGENALGPIALYE